MQETKVDYLKLVYQIFQNNIFHSLQFKNPVFAISMYFVFPEYLITTQKCMTGIFELLHLLS